MMTLCDAMAGPFSLRSMTVRWSPCELVKVRVALLVERRDAFFRLRGVVEQFNRVKGEIADAPDVVGIGIEGSLGERNGGRRPPRRLVGPIFHAGIRLLSRSTLFVQPPLLPLFHGGAVVLG